MQNLLYKTAIKWSLISIGFTILASLPAIFAGKAGMVFSSILAVLGILVSIVIYVIACLDFSKKRNHLASTGEIFGLVALMFGITLVVGLVWSFVYFQYFFEAPPEMAEFGENISTITAIQIGMNILFSFIAAVAGLQIAGVWRTFQKAGKEGWECIVPVYNYFVMAEIGKNPGWWGIMVLVPLVNIVFVIMIINGVAKAFGKDVGWTLGLIFLGFIFWPLLAWDGARYQHGDFENSYRPNIDDHLVE